eukprot:TRINITY_DN2254_c0_g1_i5.p4 TRINITY_DN2254_c0_g1~~TRINITY_DN2254_c0_g1_i5.p4  ORF type:complete len:124 (-),score=0.78 TRINITY_DN2254_c0_g1_i5:649-1020(-)
MIIWRCRLSSGCTIRMLRQRVVYVLAPPSYQGGQPSIFYPPLSYWSMYYLNSKKKQKQKSDCMFRRSVLKPLETDLMVFQLRNVFGFVDLLIAILFRSFVYCFLVFHGNKVSSTRDSCLGKGL